MKTPGPKTPDSNAPFPLRLAVRLLPEEVRDEVLGDLIEHWNLQVRDRHWLARVTWAWRQPFSTLAARLRFKDPSGEHHSDLSREGIHPGLRARRARTGISLLDLKLGFRMLIKYPGLTFVGGLAISFAVAVGTVLFVFATDFLYPTLPFDDGDRIVRIRTRSVETGLEARSPTLHDFVMWREELGLIDDLAAFRTFSRSLGSDDSRQDAIRGAEMSASAFRATRVPPLMGRSLVDEDESVGAPPVVVIGWDVWQTRLGGDPDVVGRSVVVGAENATVVGVMPESFRFPESQSLWTALRLNVLDYELGESPSIAVFGRLAEGASREEAQAELSTLGARTAAAFPSGRVPLRPEIGRFAGSELEGWAAVTAYSLNVTLFAALFLLVCANVALFVFARTATRENEIAVRSALGAGRTRIVTQLFAEALVLGGLAAIVGLVVADYGIAWGLSQFDALSGGQLPFWLDGEVTPAVVLYVGLFTVLGAVVVGVVPALKLTGDLNPQLQGAAGQGSIQRMGGLWTGVVVVQGAVTVVILALSLALGQVTRQWRAFDAGFQLEEYLSVNLTRDRETLPGSSVELPLEEFQARLYSAHQELERRIEAEPGILGVSVASEVPGGSHPRAWIEIEGEAEPVASATARRAQMASVGQDFFDLLGKTMVAGRGFLAGDFQADANVVIVNESFVRTHLGDRNAVGRRLRYLNPNVRANPPFPDQEPGPWQDIVGVVSEIGMSGSPDIPPSGIYNPLMPAASYSLHLAIHVAGAPESFAPTLHALAADVDPALRLTEVRTLDQAPLDLVMYEVMFVVLLAFGSLSLLLSNAAIYSVVSFSVARRTREIGVRVALGANPRRIVAAILTRPLLRLGVGAALGVLLLSGLMAGSGGLGPEDILLLVAFVALMFAVCVVACLVPIRRALQIEPTEALKADG